MRRVHFLKGNAKVERAHSAVWVDTETFSRPVGPAEITHHLDFGWALFQRTRALDQWTDPEWLRFTTRETFWLWLMTKLRQRTRTFVFAHNWAFDAPVLGAFEWLPKLDWRLSTAVIESPPVILKWRRGTQSLVFLDTLNWWRVPLAKLGESLGLEKLKMPARGDSPEAWDSYAKRDVEIIHKAVHAWWAFLATNDLGSFAPTLASQSFRAFRHRFMSHRILLDDSDDALTLARASLHGGRVEAFRLGRIEGPIHHFDVNSMYPTVMRAAEYPTVLQLTARDVTLDELARWLETQAVVADVTLYTTRPRFAHVIDDRLCFPIGRFRTALTTPDLADALTHGELLKVHQAAVYDRAPIFKGFVDEIYALRQKAASEGDTVRSYLLKILLNSLYGKFAQRGQVWETVGSDPSIDPRQWIEIDAGSRAVTHYRVFSRILQQRLREGESHDSHPAVAAHVTAHARAALWRFILGVGRRRVLYVDTDSLLTTAAGARILTPEVDSNRLGALKLEGVYPWIEIRGPKDYSIPGKSVVKGVRGKAEWVKPDTVIQEEWARLTGLIRKGSLDAPRTIMRTKVLRRVYTKGRVMRDGTVLPFTLTDGDA